MLIEVRSLFCGIIDISWHFWGTCGLRLQDWGIVWTRNRHETGNRWHVALKWWLIFSGLHGNVFQKIELFCENFKSYIYGSMWYCAWVNEPDFIAHCCLNRDDFYSRKFLPLLRWRIMQQQMQLRWRTILPAKEVGPLFRQTSVMAWRLVMLSSLRQRWRLQIVHQILGNGSRSSKSIQLELMNLS